MRKVILSLSALLIILYLAPSATLAAAPIDIWAQRDNAYGEGYGANHRMDGDLDGDGIKDLAISASTWNSQTGRIFIYFGGASLSSTPDVTIAGEGVNNRFGDGMSTGDFNGDHVDDLAVGAVRYNAYQGKNYVFYGRSRANWASVNSASQANVKITGEAATTGHLGNKNALGDVNQDGFDDLLIGAEYYGAGYPGRAYLFYGEATDPIDVNASTADVIINNNFGASYTALGTEVEIGDVGGDSHPDLLISIDDWLGGGTDCRAIAIWGSASLSGTINASAANLIITPDGAGFELFSYPIRAADLNNDGRKDLIAGSDHFGVGGGGARLAVFFGGPSLAGSIGTSSANIVIIGENLASSDLFSMAIGVGDVNNDSVDDLVASAYYGGSTGKGRVYVFFGGPTILTKNSASQADYIIDNPHPEGNGYFSWWISVGDVNNDGWDEFCGAADRIASTTRTAYIFSLSHIPPIVTINAPIINYANNQAQVRFSGNASDPDSGTIQSIQYSLDGGSWQNASPSDGSFDSSSEDYYFDLTITSNGSYSVRVRATDSENATTNEASYAVSSFDISGILSQTNTSILPETGAASGARPTLAVLICSFSQLAWFYISEF